uniref:Uncharacterized protein n=1 Tax=Podoviridae sp. ct8Lf7 TaxID=2827723 RepID=A0A8S5S1W1_9CAUD|nr:MAG TPA: hypothetical protein [Podoviridae sp. ct8Lf7]
MLVSKLMLLFNISDSKDYHAYIREVISKV